MRNSLDHHKAIANMKTMSESNTQRVSFQHRGRTYTAEDEDYDSFRCGEVVVYHDQQCSKAWAARVRKLRTSYFHNPESALDELFDSVARSKL